MKPFPSGPLHWVPLGLGLLVLAGGISVAVWLVQRDEGLGPVRGANEGTAAGLQTGGSLPGNTTGNVVSEGDNTEDATLSDSAELKVQRGGPAPDQAEAVQGEGAGGPVPRLATAEDASLSDSAELELQQGGPAPDQAEAVQGEGAGGAVPRLATAEDASLSDAAELDVQQYGEAPPPEGGPGDARSVQDSTDLLASDSAELSTQPGRPAPRAGSGNVAAIGDAAELVVRDSSGKVKQQQTVQ